MPQRPDGKPARAERVTFTKNASERIASAVRKVEAGDRDASGFGLGVRLQDVGIATKAFRICTFTGAWSKNTIKTLTFKFATNTPNTVSATNLFADIGTSTTTTRNCAIAKEATAWYLIAAEC